MADEFAQRVAGVFAEGDTIVSTDKHMALLVKDSNGDYAYPTLNASGLLEVTGGQTYTRGDVAGATDDGNLILVIRDDALTTLTDADGDYTALRVNSTGAMWVEFTNTTLAVTATDLDIRDLDGATDSVLLSDGTNDLVIDSSGYLTVNINGTVPISIAGTVTVTATDLDIRDLSHTQDSVKIGDGTDFLAVNSDGSINVNTNAGALDSIYTYGTATLVKDTAGTVVTRSPSADESYTGIMVSGAGYCEWLVKFGTTASEATIMSFWTTPSNPTQFVDLPDDLIVSSGETILVSAINREKKASTASDFAGHATLIRKV